MEVESRQLDGIDGYERRSVRERFTKGLATENWYPFDGSDATLVVNVHSGCRGLTESGAQLEGWCRRCEGGA